MANTKQSPPTTTKIMMNKEKANKRLAAIESEAQELRAMINEPEQPEPEQPEPEQGEVWKDSEGRLMLVTDDGHCYLEGDLSGDSFDYGPLDYGYRATRLGTFEQAYVERSEVREVINEVLGKCGAWSAKPRSFYFSDDAINAREKLVTLL